MAEPPVARRRIVMISHSPREVVTARLFVALRDFLAGRHQVSLRLGAPRRSLLGKLASMVLAGFGMLPALLRADILLLHSYAGFSLPQLVVARLARVRVVMFLWDLYPESFHAIGRGRSRAAIGIAGWLERRVMRNADLVVVPNEDYLRHPAIAALPRTDCLPLWLAHGERVVPPGPPGSSASLRLAFAGQINAIRDLDGTLRALARALNGPAEISIFSRDPFPDTDAPAFPETFRIRHHGLLDQAALAGRLAAMDAGLVSLRPDFALPAFPSKIVSYVAGGLPVVYRGPDAPALARLLSETGVGVALDDGAPDPDLAAKLRAIRADFAPRQADFLDRIRLDREKLDRIL